MYRVHFSSECSFPTRRKFESKIPLFLLFAESSTLGELTTFACDGDPLVLECLSPNEVIRVTRANYGRFSIAVCNEEARTDLGVNCFSPKARGIVDDR